MLSVIALQTEQVTGDKDCLQTRKLKVHIRVIILETLFFLLIGAFRMLFALNIRSKDIITRQENLKCWTRGKNVCPQRQILARRKD